MLKRAEFLGWRAIAVGSPGNLHIRRMRSKIAPCELVRYTNVAQTRSTVNRRPGKRCARGASRDTRRRELEAVIVSSGRVAFRDSNWCPSQSTAKFRPADEQFEEWLYNVL